MAYTLACMITIDGRYYLPAVSGIEIESSWKEGDKATVGLAGRAVMGASESNRNVVSLEDIFRVGMRIKIELWYDGQPRNVEFEGYISQIKINNGLELICTDEMYRLSRSKPMSKSYKKVGLSALLTELVAGVRLVNVPDIEIENFQIKRATAAQVLDELRNKYGLAIYFRGRQLYAGLPYLETDNSLEVAKYDMLGNVASHDLEYVRADDVRIKVRASSFLSNSKKLEAVVGDEDGQERSLFFGPQKSVSALEALALQEIKKFKIEGYKGELTGFGLPYCRHGGTAQVQDSRYEARGAGRYLIEGTKVSFGSGGFRRTVVLGAKV